jgi:Superinfection immunity protein
MLILAIVIAYCLPTVIASLRGHRQQGAIFALNLLLGWTLIGWVAALVWGLTNSQPPAAQQQPAYYHEVEPGKFVPVLAQAPEKEDTLRNVRWGVVISFAIGVAFFIVFVSGHHP